jgi:hypothetical protein
MCFYSCIKMFRKWSPFTDQIRSYNKNRCILYIQAKDIFNEICLVYGNNELSFSSVTRWCQTFKSGVDSVTDAPHHCSGKNLLTFVEKVPLIRYFENIITGDETWVHFYEPKRNIHNNIWTTKGS